MQYECHCFWLDKEEGDGPYLDRAWLIKHAKAIDSCFFDPITFRILNINESNISNSSEEKYFTKSTLHLDACISLKSSWFSKY